MELDKCLMFNDQKSYSEDDPHINEWCRIWSKPVNRSLFDTVKLTEQECNDMLPQIETMKYGGSDLMLSPALEEFVLQLTGSDGIHSNYILFRKTVMKDKQVKQGDHATMTLTPVLDAYFFFGNGNVPDVVVSMGTFRTDTDDGRYNTGTYQRPMWVKDYDLLQDKYLTEYFRYTKMEYLLIQKALYDRPEVFVETGKQITIDPQPTKKKRKGKGRRRIVKAVKVLRISQEEFADYTKAHREMTCPCWGVIGHWRNYKSGKRVWISPYRKGKQRHDPAAYSSKEYKMEEVQHA